MYASLMNTQNAICIICTLLVVGLSSAAPPVLGDIYSWTDENGVRHYSDTPPDDLKEVNISPEIPHDPEKDERNQAAHQEMIKQFEAEKQASEKRELEKRLKKTEKKLQAAERKAEQALDEAKAAREIAEEKQRYREVYVVPGIGPGGHRPPRPVPYDPYKRSPIP
jgi:hypothetical protein